MPQDDHGACRYEVLIVSEKDRVPDLNPPTPHPKAQTSTHPSAQPTAAPGVAPGVARLRPHERVLAECLRLIGRQLRRSCTVTMPAALVLAGGLYGHVNLTMLVLWVGLVLGATAILIFVAGFDIALDTAASIENRRNEVVTVAGLVGMAWGCAPLIVFPHDDARQLLLALVLIGMLGSISFGTLLLRPAFAALATPIVAALVIRFALVGDAIHMAAVGGVIVSTGAMLLHTLEASTTSTVLVRNRIENDLLLRRLMKFQEIVVAHESELDRLYAEMGEHQQRDELTGAFNRRQFMQEIAGGCHRASSGYDPFSLVLLEIDEFDRITEMYGSTVGDELIRKVSAIIQAGLRTDDCFARTGGAQFGMILENALTEGALICVERIRRKLASTPIDAGEPILVSTSMGLIGWDQSVGAREMVVHADEAMQTARRAGKNRIQVWGDEQRNRGLLTM